MKRFTRALLLPLLIGFGAGICISPAQLVAQEESVDDLPEHYGGRHQEDVSEELAEHLASLMVHVSAVTLSEGEQ